MYIQKFYSAEPCRVPRGKATALFAVVMSILPESMLGVALGPVSVLPIHSVARALSLSLPPPLSTSYTHAQISLLHSQSTLPDYDTVEHTSAMLLNALSVERSTCTDSAVSFSKAAISFSSMTTSLSTLLNLSCILCRCSCITCIA